MPLTPSWLYYLVAIVMLVVAAYSAVLLALSAASHRRVGADVEASHVVMGLAMAGMFVNSWMFGPDLAWELTFGGFLIWFLVRAARSVQTYGLHLPHTLVHAVMSFAMLLMYWFPMGSGAGRSVSMSMTASAAGGRADPGLAFLIAFGLLASAVFTIASPSRGGSVYGTHVRPTPALVSDSMTNETSYLDGTPSSASGIEAAIAAPGLLDATHVVMCLAMAFMLLLML